MAEPFPGIAESVFTKERQGEWLKSEGSLSQAFTGSVSTRKYKMQYYPKQSDLRPWNIRIVYGLGLIFDKDCCCYTILAVIQKLQS